LKRPNVIPVPSRVEGSTEAPVSAFAESTGAKWRNLLKTDFSTRPAEGGLDSVQLAGGVFDQTGFQPVALPARSK
jgi:hypothetical protein